MDMSKAELRVSSCGRFAALVSSTGCFYIVWSKEFANYMIHNGVQTGLITEDDAIKLHLAVYQSRLPWADDNVSVAIVDALVRCNQQIYEALEAKTSFLYDETIIRLCIERFEKHHNAPNN